jgi:hypothetical protein
MRLFRRRGGDSDEYGGEIPVPAVPARPAGQAELPPVGPAEIGGVRLPPGRPAVPDPGFADGGPLPPALWISDAAVPGVAAVWRRLVDRFPRTGLWPLVLRPMDRDERRPWDEGELSPVTEADVDALNPVQILARVWEGTLAPAAATMPGGLGMLAPFGPAFPGPARELPSAGPAVRVPAAALAPDGAARLGLVRCRRPADAVAVAGWEGAVNVLRPAEVSAVLRSWEDRFGAVLAGLSFDTLTLLLPRPPRTESEAAGLAAELASLCPDELWVGHDADLGAMSRSLVGAAVRELWFD